MQYGEFKARLTKLHKIDDNDEIAFRGRLRVLRELGVPMKEAKGSGKRLTFDHADLFETHFALTLDEFGLAPRYQSLAVSTLRDSGIYDVLAANPRSTWLLALKMRLYSGSAIFDFRNRCDIRIINSHRLDDIGEFFKPNRWVAIINIRNIFNDTAI